MDFGHFDTQNKFYRIFSTRGETPYEKLAKAHPRALVARKEDYQGARVWLLKAFLTEKETNHTF